MPRLTQYIDIVHKTKSFANKCLHNSTGEGELFLVEPEVLSLLYVSLYGISTHSNFNILTIFWEYPSYIGIIFIKVICAMCMAYSGTQSIRIIAGIPRIPHVTLYIGKNEQTAINN